MVRKGVTVWPGVRVPEPVVSVQPCALDENGEVVVFLSDTSGASGAWAFPVLPNGFYLGELWQLDTESPDEVLEFCTKYGPVGHGGDIPGSWLRWEPWRSAVGRGLVLLDQNRDTADRVQTLEEIGLFQGLLRGLVYLWMVGSGQRSVDEVLPRWRSDPHAQAAHKPGPFTYGEPAADSAADYWLSPDNVADALRHVSAALEAPLARFHVRVLVDADPAIAMRANCFEAACLQFTNDIADSADFKECANETCGRLFTRHRGRATQGKYHMTGVKFCSVECARAQKQREYRRRQKQKGAKP